MSHVPKLQHALGKIREARAQVADLRGQASEGTGGRAQKATIRADYLDKGKAIQASPAANSEARVNNRRSPVGPSGRDSAARQRNQMVSSLDEKVGPMNLRTSAFVKSTLHSAPPDRDTRLFKSEAHEDTPPVAFGSALTRKPAFIESSEATVMTRHGAGVRYRGTEYITAISTPSTTVGRGQILYCLPVSPQFITSTRLQLAAQMFTRYIFRSIKFYYAGTAPTTTAGSLMMFGDYDPSQNPGQSPGDATLRYSFTHNAAEFSVWQQAYCEITDKVYEDMLYCDPDSEPRWSTQGCFWLLSSGNIAPNLELGKLVIEYEIDFAVPDFRGTIPFSPTVVQTLQVPATTAGNALTFVGYSGARGAYIVRIDNAPTVNVVFNTSVNAYNQGTQALTLQQGMVFFCATSPTGVGLQPLWTPDIYASDYVLNNACVMNVTTATPSSFSATLFPIQAITND